MIWVICSHVKACSTRMYSFKCQYEMTGEGAVQTACENPQYYEV